MNITRQDIFEVGYISCLAVYEHFDEVARGLDKLHLRPGLPADKKDAIFQISAQASRLDASKSQGVDPHSYMQFMSELDSLTSWITGLPLDDEVQS